MSLSASIGDMARRYAIPSRAQAAAVLSAYSEATVPLPAHLAPEWWGTADTEPGRWWVLAWLVAGYKRAGDKFAGADSVVWWRGPLPTADAEFFWREMLALAKASDDWQARQGDYVASPPVDAGPFLPRGRSYSATVAPKPARLVRFLRDAWEALKRWRAARPRPTTTASDQGGMVLFLVAAALAATARRRRRR